MLDSCIVSWVKRVQKTQRPSDSGEGTWRKKGRLDRAWMEGRGSACRSSVSRGT